MIFAMKPSFIVADLTLAADIAGMEHLVPLGEDSRMRALADATTAGRGAA